MKRIAKGIAFESFSLYMLSVMLVGVSIRGGLPTILLGGTVFAILSFLLRPLLNIISYPFHLITLGAFTIVINGFLLYLLTLVVKQISITAFVFQGFSFWGFVVPTIHFNLFFAFLAAALLQSSIKFFIVWLTSN